MIYMYIFSGCFLGSVKTTMNRMNRVCRSL